MSIRDLARELERQPAGATLSWGVIAAVSAGPPKTVSVNVSGSTTATTGIRYLASYTPTVGDVVVMVANGPDLLVIGSINPAVTGGGTGTVTINAAKIALLGTQTLTTGSTPNVSFDTVKYDTPGGMVNLGADPTKITITVAGKYDLKAGASFAANSTGQRIVNITVNGTSVARDNRTAVSGDTTAMSCSAEKDLVVGDVVQVVVFQDSGSSIAVGGHIWTFLSATLDGGAKGDTGATGATGPAGADGASGLQTRTTIVKTSSSLASGASQQTTLALPAAFRLYSIQTDHPARVRVYQTSAQQTADLSRARGTDPDNNAGVTLDYVTTSTLGTSAPADLSPLVDGVDLSTTPSGAVPITFTNLDTVTRTITATLTYIRTE
jgi:hypothetical protein